MFLNLFQDKFSEASVRRGHHTDVKEPEGDRSFGIRIDRDDRELQPTSGVKLLRVIPLDLASTLTEMVTSCLLTSKRYQVNVLWEGDVAQG